MTPLNLTVNGESTTIDVDPEMPLLWVLRDIIGLTGTKYACGRGLCGSCTVHLGGRAVRSCVTSVGNVGDQAVLTIEGLAAQELHPVQQAWIDQRVSQCGYCQAGQIMSAAALLSANPTPTDADIDSAMADNLCRCGTYQRIRRAIHAASEGGA